MIDSGLKVNNLRMGGRRETLSKKKDQSRSKVALARKRVKGLFVNKKKELILEKIANNGNYSDESETVEPD